MTKESVTKVESMEWLGGSIYTGEIKGEDLVEGLLIFPDGSRSEGSFKHGDLWDGTWRSSDGTAVRNFSEGIDQDGVNAATSLASSYIHDGLPFDHSVDSAIDWYFEMEPEMEPLQNRYVVDEIEKRIRQSLDDEYSSIAWAAIVAYIKENHVIVTRKGLLFNKYRIEMTESVKKDIEDLIHENAINFRLDADELREAVMNEVNKINEQGQ